MGLDELVLGEELIHCKECNGLLEYIEKGIYVCKSCGTRNVSDLGKVKLFLQQNGVTPMADIIASTGVSKDKIERYLKKGYIEIPEGSDYYLKCEKCGADIRYGRFCEDCVRELAGSIKNEFPEDEVGAKPTKNSNSRMRYFGKKVDK